MKRSVTGRSAATLAIPAFLLFASTAAWSQDDNDRRQYCEESAGQYCLNTYGVDSQECHEQYIPACIRGEIGSRAAPEDSFLDPSTAAARS